MRWVITGANRGIGLEMVRQLGARGEVVEAATRDPAGAKELAALSKQHEGRVHVHACDVQNDESVRAFGERLSAGGNAVIDVLVNNAGVMGEMQSLTDLDLDDVRNTFDVNTLGPIRMTCALLPMILRSERKRVVHITSGMGSIVDNTSGGAYGYRMSKAALNMANKSMSRDFRDRGIIAVVMNPGWVQTDMGGSGAPTSVQESVTKILGRIDGMTPAENGAFLDYKGGTLPY